MALQQHTIENLKNLYVTIQNEFGTTIDNKNIAEVRELFTKIIMQISANMTFSHKILENKIKIGEYGSSVEEYYQLQAEMYDTKDYDEHTKDKDGSLIPYIYKINSSKVFVILEQQDIQKALQSEQDFISYINTIVSRLQNDYNIYSFDQMVNVIKKLETIATKIKIIGSGTVSDYLYIDKQFVATTDAVALNMKLPTTKFSLLFNKDKTHNDKIKFFSEKVYLILPLNSVIDFEFFKSSELKTLYNNVDDILFLPIEKPMLISNNTLKFFNVKHKLVNKYVAERDLTKYILHTQDIYNFSPFSNACVIEIL